MHKEIDWDDLFMAMTFLVAMKSKDPNTRLGAVIVGLDHEVRSVGFNGLARGLYDDIEERSTGEDKYMWFEHAERNAIYNASRVGIPLKDCTLYVNGIPCMDCARGVIQSGISEVVYHKTWFGDNSKRWKITCNTAKEMLIEAGIRLRWYDKPITKITALLFGKEYNIT